MNKLAIFASGNGTNAQQIAEYFMKNETVSVSLILSNRKDAFVLTRAKNLDIPSFVFDRHQFYNTPDVLKILIDQKIDLIVLAGFLWLVPVNILQSFNNRIVNIHPALLPKYGGKGMYGDKVHQAVIDNKDKESGISIHYVNEVYDDGEIIFQARCNVDDRDTPESLAKKVHELEYKHYPEVIEQLVGEL